MEVLIYILTAILCYWLAGLIHETGHIIIGLICGWKFNLLVIGPLGLKVNETGKLQFYVEKRLVLWGGVGGTMPQKAEDKNCIIWGKILLGGPLASILTGVFFLPLGIIEKKYDVTASRCDVTGYGNHMCLTAADQNRNHLFRRYALESPA